MPLLVWRSEGRTPRGLASPAVKSPSFGLSDRQFLVVALKGAAAGIYSRQYLSFAFCRSLARGELDGGRTVGI